MAISRLGFGLCLSKSLLFPFQAHSLLKRPELIVPGFIPQPWSEETRFPWIWRRIKKPVLVR